MSGVTSSFVLSIDVEPRGRHDVIGAVEEWGGFFTCIDYLAGWRERYQDKTGRAARFCWLLRFDDQIEQAFGSRTWIVDRFQDPLSELVKAGDVLGVHHHLYRPDRAYGWREDYTDPSFVHDSILAAQEAFVSALGYRADCVSIGAGWLDQTAVEALDEAGFKYDMTLTPGRPMRAPEAPGAGVYPDYLSAPRRPYHPSRKDYLRPGRSPQRRNIWLLPVSMSCGMHPGEWHPGYDATHRMDQFNMSEQPGFVSAHLDAQLAAGEQLMLCLLRTGDLSNPSHDTWLRANGEYLLNHPLLNDIAFETPSQAMERYTSSSKGRREAPALRP